MTCAETRRQLPEPDPAALGQVEQHLLTCPPCRVEQQALREVDRRIEQLGQHRLQLASQVLQVSRTPSPLPLLPRSKTSPLLRLTGLALVGAGLLFLVLLAFFRVR